MTVLVESTEAAPLAFEGRSSASGPSPYRVLLVGAGAIAADERLATAVAGSLAEHTGHGVDVETVAARPLAEAVDGSLLADRDLSRTDAVVIVLDLERARRAVEAAREGVRTMLDRIGARLTAGAALVLVVPPAGDAGRTLVLADELRRVVEEAAAALTPVVALEDDRSRWAGRIGDAAARALIDPMVDFVSDDQYDEDLRLDAVDALPPRDALWVTRFQGVVDAARDAYGTASAAFSIIDADAARYAVTVGFPDKVLRRGQTICNRVLRTYGGLIVGDAQADGRFHRQPEVRSGDVRFYAGYRIEAADGAPVGTLCVFDPIPRTVADTDLVALRDLAITAQRTLWRFQRETAASR